MEEEQTKFISELRAIYSNKLTVARGKVYSYLGMHFDFSKIGTVQVGMISYSKEIIDDFPEPITSTAPTPAADHQVFRKRELANVGVNLKTHAFKVST